MLTRVLGFSLKWISVWFKSEIHTKLSISKFLSCSRVEEKIVSRSNLRQPGVPVELNGASR